MNIRKMSIENEILSLIPDKYEYITGFADLSGLPGGKYKNYNYAVVIGKKMDDEIIDSIKDGPSREYFNLYNETNKDLSELAGKISEKLSSFKIKNLVVEPTVTEGELGEKFLKTLSYDFSHKMAATRAGLGWIGKTALFVSEKFGPRLRLATILTPYPLKCENMPVDKSKCGKCSICVEACPAGAATGKLWNKNMKRDDFYNPFKCLEKCKEITLKNMGEEKSICGICISVCPLGRKAGEKNPFKELKTPLKNRPDFF